MLAGPVVQARAADAAQPAPAAPAYFYDANGRRPIRVSDSEFLVHLRRAERAAPGRPQSLPARVRLGSGFEAVHALEDRLERRGLHVVRGGDGAALRARPDVLFALPLVYPNGSDVPLYQTDRIIAAFHEGVTEQQVRALAALLGCDARPLARGTGRYHLIVRDTRVSVPIAVANAVHERRDLVKYAHPDFFAPMVRYAPPVINDPLYHSHQWHLDGDTSKGATAGSDINVEAAWDTDHGADAEGLPQVRVSILDECVEKLHPDLFPNWAAGLDLDNDPPDDDPSPDAGQRHGTACAGVAVAAANNIGVRGAAPRCGLIGVKFFGAPVSDIADGYYFSMDPDNNGDHSDGAAVMSNSWGFADGTFLPPDLANAINTVAQTGRNGLGCLVLFAAANDDHTVNGVSALAQLPSVMAVGGTNSNATHTEFSDVGPEVGIAAPTNDRGDDGVRFSWLDITTTDNTGSSGYNGLPDPNYTNAFGGTSSATPLAAGVLALIISQDPGMSAAQARAILQHTAVRLDEPYGRFDAVTGHSHRFGFGRCDAGAAISAADAGIRWPDRIKTLSASATGNDITLTWTAPPNDYASSLMVRSDRPFAWMPQDGSTYAVSDEVAPGVFVIYNGVVRSVVDAGASSGSFFYAVYPRSSANRYGFGARTHLIRDGINLFFDNSEGVDPGWEHGGRGDEWTRGTPTSAVSPFSQAVVGSGPLAGTVGTRAIGGNNCWGTDLVYTYDADADAWLQTPLLNLTGVTVPVILDYYDWCLLETYYDRCTIEVLDADDNFLGYLDADTGGDYDWTRRAYDLTPFAGQPIRVRFRLVSDGLFQRDGWFLDEVRVVVAGNVPLPPVAKKVYAETAENTPVLVTLTATDPNVGQTLDYVISSLPAHGQLSDPNGGPITSAPYTLLNHGRFVNFAPEPDYQGADAFTYHANDGALDSNSANVRLSIGTPVAVYPFPLNSNPGWITEGDWAFGLPLGQGGDPSAGFTGSFVYGYNLAGAYPDNLPRRYLTMLPLNCTGLSRVTLKFARWLGVEASAYDNASIEVSTDGANWITVWNHSGATLVETSWSQQSYDISEIADDQPFVLIRWGMGPTDTNTTYGGWNIDDVVIWAIGSPSANQPPLAVNVAATTARDEPVDVALTASDANNDLLTFTITALPANGMLADPNGGDIVAVPYTLADGGNVVRYTPQTGFAGADGFQFRAEDAVLTSNVADAMINVLDPAPFPFTEDFDGGAPLGPYWDLHSTVTGRISVTSANGPSGLFHLTMDSSADSSFSLNEATLVANLAGAANVILAFDWKDFSDETHALPASWTGSANGDGVAISADGVTWYRVFDLFDATPPPERSGAADASDEQASAGTRADNYQTVTLSLDVLIAEASISYTNTFRIRFQQYDNFPIPSDGIAIDNVRLIQGTGDPLITTPSLPAATLDEPYGPVQLEVIGGDPPLVWSVLDVYDEDSLGPSQFAAVGSPQDWHADDAAFDYTLPFAFPFYGGSYTAVKIATDGWINFGAYVGSTYNNSTALLMANRRIAVLWDDLRTDRGGDVFIDDSVAGQFTVRWDAVVRATQAPCHFSATLFDDGRIRFHYGSGNTTLTPTVGVSAGDNSRFFLSAYDGASVLTLVDSIEIEQSRLPPGITLSSAGELSGTPTAEGLFKPIFRVFDASARSHRKKLPLAVNVPTLFGDFDGDLDVDDDDFAQFRLCYTGPEGGPLLPGCEPGDSDGDNDIDCIDWRAFEAAYEASSGATPLLPVSEFVAVLLGADVPEADRCIADVDDDGDNDGDDVAAYVAAAIGA